MKEIFIPLLIEVFSIFFQIKTKLEITVDANKVEISE